MFRHWNLLCITGRFTRYTEYLDLECSPYHKVFYSVGFTGMIFCVDVITADTSTLRDRGLAFAFTSSPYIITAFAGAAASEHFYESNWRWAYGTFAIVLPVVALPMFGLLRFNLQKAKKKGLWQEKDRSGRSIMQSVVYYVIEFDRKYSSPIADSLTKRSSTGSFPLSSWSGSFPPSLHYRWFRS